MVKKPTLKEILDMNISDSKALQMAWNNGYTIRGIAIKLMQNSWLDFPTYEYAKEWVTDILVKAWEWERYQKTRFQNSQAA